MSGRRTRGRPGARRWACWAVAAAGLAAGAATAALAAATLSPVQVVSANGRDSRFPEIVVDAGGNAVLAWLRLGRTHRHVQARMRLADGTLTPIQTISPRGVGVQEPHVAVDPQGNAVFVWLKDDRRRVQARARSADGVLGPVQGVSDPGEHQFSPQVAMDAAGNAVFTWSRSDGPPEQIRAEARWRSADGTLGAVETLSDPGHQQRSPSVAVDADGNAVFAWARLEGDHYRVEARARSADGTLGPVQMLSDAGQDALNPVVGVDAQGQAVFAWAVHGPNRIQARARAGDGILGSTVDIASTGRFGGEPRIAVAVNGSAVVAWTWTRFDQTEQRIQAVFRSADGTLSPVRTLARGESAGHPRVAVDAVGNAVFIWSRLIDTTWRQETRTRAIDGTLGPTVTVSRSFAGQAPEDPRVAVDPAGHAVFAWSRFDGTDWRIQSRAHAAD